MNAPPLLESNRLRRLWSSRLWILAGVLGAITVYTGTAVIHDGSNQRLALGIVTQATAMHLTTLASGRLERLAIEGFAPAPLIAPANRNGSKVSAEALATRQREGIACACRELLAASQFFRYDRADGTLDVAPVSPTGAKLTASDDSVLADLARFESETQRGWNNATSRLVTDERLGDRSVVALVQRDERGSAIAVYGMVVDTRQTFTSLFERGPHDSSAGSGGLARLDSLSLEVRGPNERVLFGAVGAGRARAIVRTGGPLRGLTVTIAVSPNRVASPLIEPHSRTRLWNLGALLIATVVAIGIAIGASRRELLLARARSDFIAGVSHDLRMPLAQILIASETLALRRERTDTERTSLASSIVRETRRLAALVDNVLLFSRSGAIELKPVMGSVNVDELLGDVVESVRLAVEDAGQTIEISPAPPVTARADQRLVRQALVNLVDNALKYGTAGQRIRLGAEQRGDVVHLSVEDEGAGIPAAYRDRIFEPYARLPHDQVSERTGTGLGLAVVRQIAEACGGRVWIEDGRTRGARAVIELRATTVVEPVAVTSEVA